MADGLDCNCSGSSAPLNNFPFGGFNSMNGINQMGGGMAQLGNGFGQSFMNRGGPMMGQRIFPGMFP